MKNYVSHLECSYSGKIFKKNCIHSLSELNKPLLVKYDIKKIKKEITRTQLKQNNISGFWRYSFLLPVKKKYQISLNEVTTPLLETNQINNFLDFRGKLFIKDESYLPTSSFKARGLSLAVSMAKQLNLKHLAIPTNGNAGAALAAYSAKAKIKCTVFCPNDTPKINVREIKALGADVYLVNGFINECGKIVEEGKKEVGWFDVSTLKEPYRIEGKKTMGLELAEQFNWELPDVIIYPTGGGTGLIGMWKAFKELEELGWIKRKPKMVAVQSIGCAPIVRAWEKNDEFGKLWDNPKTIASGIRVPIAIGDFLILRALRESQGFAISVTDQEILKDRDLIAKNEGLLMCPEGSATYSGFKKAISNGMIKKNENVVLFNCASGLKYPLPKVTKSVNKKLKINFKNFISDQ